MKNEIKLFSVVVFISIVLIFICAVLQKEIVEKVEVNLEVDLSKFVSNWEIVQKYRLLRLKQQCEKFNISSQDNSEKNIRYLDIINVF